MRTKLGSPVGELSAKLTEGVSYQKNHTPSVTATPCHLEVNCPNGAREATLGCPHRGGKIAYGNDFNSSRSDTFVLHFAFCILHLKEPM